MRKEERLDLLYKAALRIYMERDEIPFVNKIARGERLYICDYCSYGSHGHDDDCAWANFTRIVESEIGIRGKQ